MNQQAVLESIADRYAHGECGNFALACFEKYQDYGWHLVSFESAVAAALSEAVHVACQVSDGVYFDAYGFCTLWDLAERYGMELSVHYASRVEVEDFAGNLADDRNQAADHLELLLQILREQGLLTRDEVPQPTKTSLFLLAYSQFRNEVLTLLAMQGCGPFDGGCFVCAKALQAVLSGSELVVLTRADGLADHAAVLYDGLLWDTLGPLPNALFLKRFNYVEHRGRYVVEAVRPWREFDLPDALQCTELELKLTSIFEKVIKSMQ